MAVSVVIPSLNEAPTIGRIVERVYGSGYASEVIVVDGGSTDGTPGIARAAGAKVLPQSRKKFPGKGIAMQDGIRAAKGDIIAFIDADIRNFDPATIRKLTAPISAGKADLVKAKYGRKAGRVTELTARPLLRILFPDVILEQPLSGEVAGRAGLLKSMRLKDGWGVDIGIVLDAVMRGARICEVDLAYKEHKTRPFGDLERMSRDVSETIVEKASERGGLLIGGMEKLFAKLGFLIGTRCYGTVNLLSGSSWRKGDFGLAIFDMDNTLLRGRLINALAERFGFKKKLARIRSDVMDGRISGREGSNRIAKCLEGTEISEIRKCALGIELNRGVMRLVKELKRRGVAIAILSDSYDFAVEAVAGRIGADEYVANVLEHEDGRATGRIHIEENLLPCHKECHACSFCKMNGLHLLAKNARVSAEQCIMVGDGDCDAHAMAAAGLGIAFRGSEAAREAADIVIDGGISEILDYL